MSRASKWLDKQRKLNIKGKSMPLYCQHCQSLVGQDVYDMERPWEYTCKMCGNYAFEDLKNRIELNEQYDLGKEVEKIENNA